MSQQQQQQQAKKPKRELQGQRPAPLKIAKDSHKIQKPLVAGNIAHRPPTIIAHRPPTIIYLQSPEVIHTETREFMTLVQRLTGRVNAHDNNSSTSSSSSLISIQSPTCHALIPHNSHTSIPGNPNIGHVDAFLNPRGGGLDFPVKEDNFNVSVSNPSEFSGSILSPYSTVQSHNLLSPSIQYGSMSPFSPNFFLPSPRLLSPNIFKEFPLCTPQPDYFYSPYGHLLRTQSEPVFSPRVRPTMLPSTPPTDCDLFHNQQKK